MTDPRGSVCDLTACDIEAVKIARAHEAVTLTTVEGMARLTPEAWQEWVSRFGEEPRARITAYLNGLRATGARVTAAERRDYERAAIHVAEQRAAQALFDAMPERVREADLRPAQKALLARYTALLRAHLIKQSKIEIEDDPDLADRDHEAVSFAASGLTLAAEEQGKRQLMVTAARTASPEFWRIDEEGARRITEQQFRYDLEHYGVGIRRDTRVVIDRISRARYRIGANSGDARLEISRLLPRLHSREITVDEFRQEMRSIVRRYSTSSYRAGRTVAGVSPNLTKADQKALLGMRREEDRFIEGFLRDLTQPGYGRKRALWRAEQYARGTASQAAANKGYLSAMAERGLRVRWVYDPTAHHCPQCIDRNGQEWPADQVPEIPGRCPRCMSSCRCHLEPVGVVGMGPEATPAAGWPPELEIEMPEPGE